MQVRIYKITYVANIVKNNDYDIEYKNIIEFINKRS